MYNLTARFFKFYFNTFFFYQAALRGIRLVEKIERIGLEEILATSPTESSTLHQTGLKRTLRGLPSKFKHNHL